MCAIAETYHIRPWELDEMAVEDVQLLIAHIDARLEAAEARKARHG